MSIPAADRERSFIDKAKTDSDFTTTPDRTEIEDAHTELARHVAAGTRPADSTEVARLLLAALEIEYPSNAIVEWMSRTSMELTRHVQHQRSE